MNQENLKNKELYQKFKLLYFMDAYHQYASEVKISPSRYAISKEGYRIYQKRFLIEFIKTKPVNSRIIYIKNEEEYECCYGEPFFIIEWQDMWIQIWFTAMQRAVKSIYPELECNCTAFLKETFKDQFEKFSEVPHSFYRTITSSSEEYQFEKEKQLIFDQAEEFFAEVLCKKFAKGVISRNTVLVDEVLVEKFKKIVAKAYLPENIEEWFFWSSNIPYKNKLIHIHIIFNGRISVFDFTEYKTSRERERANVNCIFERDLKDAHRNLLDNSEYNEIFEYIISLIKEEKLPNLYENDKEIE